MSAIISWIVIISSISISPNINTIKNSSYGSMDLIPGNNTPLNYNSEQNPVMMPEIVVTAFRKPLASTATGQTINLKNTIIMPEIVVTAEKTDSAQSQNRSPALTSHPNNRQSFARAFNRFGLLLLLSILPLVWFFFHRAKSAKLNVITIRKEMLKK